MSETFDWLAPSLIWQADGIDYRRAESFRPQLLEFHSDSFMDDFLAATGDPDPETFKKVIAAPEKPGATLKLFQPVHGNFYLVSASLCCRQSDFPDRQVRKPDGESVFFVLRKLVDGKEYAWVIDDRTKSKNWQSLNGKTNRQAVVNEERLPLLTAAGGNGRTILFGYLPVASRETYGVAPKDLDLETGDQFPDMRIEELAARFTCPLSQPQTGGVAHCFSVGPLDAKMDDQTALKVSVYLLLDLWEFLLDHLNDVAIALRDNLAASFSGDKAQEKAELMQLLKGQPLYGSVTLAVALQLVANQRDDLNKPGGGDLTEFSGAYNLKNHPLPNAFLDMLLDHVQHALPDERSSLVMPKFGPGADALYALRCVYERPQCDPQVQVVSQRSQPFQLAPFFDADAPARPVRIPLPTDVSLAALRKFKKGVSFMISEAMNKKIAAFTGKEKGLLKDPPDGLNPEPEDGWAFICSFSIQIIFIVAFFLLLMFVVILNFVFWWLPFFRICLPIPKKLSPG